MNQQFLHDNIKNNMVSAYKIITLERGVSTEVSIILFTNKNLTKFFEDFD